MKVFKGPEKGQSAPIQISETQSDRVLIGLSWDMKQFEKIKLPKPQIMFVKSTIEEIENIIHRYRTFKFMDRPVNEHDAPDARDDDFGHFDIDLYCYIFDENGEHVDTVEPDYKNLIDESETVYHSGDDFSGLGGGDDEQIYIETKKLPANYKHFLFVVKSDCAFSLDEVQNTTIRVADSKTNDDFIKADISPAANLNAAAFVFAHMAEIDGTWTLTNIGEYADADFDVAAYFKDGLV